MPEISTKNRMIAAGVTLFAQSGFHGVTTKDIAQSANVSEGNIFRYFPSKRDLFIACVDSELDKLSVRAEPLARIAEAADSRDALRAMFEMITDTVASHPDLVRLLQFSALEFGKELGPMYRRHLDGIVNAAARNFGRWSQDYGFRDVSAQVTVLSFLATVLLLQNYPVITGCALPFPSVKHAASEYAELWYRVLCDAPASCESKAGTAAAGSLG